MHMPGRYPNGSTSHQRHVEHLGEITEGVTLLSDGLLFVVMVSERLMAMIPFAKPAVTARGGSQ